MNRMMNFLAACLLASILAACGGGGGTNDGCVNIDPSRSSSLPGCGGGPVTNPGTGGSTSFTLALAMSDNALTPAKSAKVSATLKNDQGQPVANAVVSFTSTDSTAGFLPATGTALTDASGVASVQLAAGSQAGAFVLTASYNSGTKTTLGYTVTISGTNGSAPTLVLAMTDSSGAAISTLTPSQGARISATLKNILNQPIANALVSFSSTDSTAVFTPSTGTVLTDANGVASIQLGAGALSGAFTLNASYTSGASTAKASSNYTVALPGGSNAPSLTLAIIDSGGAAFNALTPTRGGTLVATVKNNQNLPVSGAVVTFSSSDATAVLSPAIGTALTDASGTASVQLAAGTQAGAFAASASSSVGGTGVKATANYTVTFPVLSFSEMTLNPTTLAAGGNASISITVLSNGSPYAQTVPVSFSSPCAALGKAVIGSPVLTQNGVAVASYTDKGCGTADTITATATLPNATLTKSGTLNVLPGTAGSIKFVGVDNSNIALRGTGGAGRPEYSTVKFQVFDMNGSFLAGRQVNFVFSDSNSTTTTGGLSLSPSSATTAADGTVTTVVANGTQPTSVRVVAKVANTNPPLTTVSSILVVSNGVPDQAHFSLSTEIGNCEGWSIDQLCSNVNVILGDHFGNPVPDGTAVNFSAEGGNIGASCVTKDGRCSVPLYSSNPRPSGGRVTVLAYALGEENLVDNNGNNVYDSGDSFMDKSPDIFRDDNENGSWNAGEACIGPNTNRTCTTPGDGVYNGVLRKPQLPSAQTLYVSSQLVQQFSTSSANITISPATMTCTPGSAVDAEVRVTDLNGLMMPARTSITFATTWSGAGPVYPAGATVPNVVLGVGQTLNPPTYAVTITCPAIDSPGKLIVTVTAPSGTVTTATRNID
jgi:hypothetical protein